MLQSVKTYVYDRRKGLSQTAGFVGGIYLVRRYVNDRLEELKVKMEQERLARENLRRRFQTAQDDVSYTVLALLPTLADQIMQGMDVESVTQELQSRSKARTSGLHLLHQNVQHPQQNREDNSTQQREQHTSLESSVVDVARDSETHSDTGSTAPSIGSTLFIEASSREERGSGTSSWIEASTSARSPAPSSPKDEGTTSHNAHEYKLSDSVLTVATTSTESSLGNDSRLSESVTSMSAASDSSASKTKAELWTEVKMLTFTRTLTTLYSMTLMCLLTTIQLTMLARSKYIESVLELELEERLQEELQSQLSFTNLLLGDRKKIESLLSGDVPEIQDEVERGEVQADGIREEVGRKFLTLSWWLLHVGWKDVGERVRRAVEEVFEGVSLKTKLAAIDLHRLIRDVRRRVEHEITFEGNERRINFLSTLLPPTPEMIQHVLTQGGFSPNSPSETYVPHVEGTQDTTTLSSSQLSHEFDASPAIGLSGLFNNPNNPYNIPPSPSNSRIIKPVCPHHRLHRHSHDAGGTGQDTNACVDCASISHMLHHGKSTSKNEAQEAHPHPPSYTFLRPVLGHVQDTQFMSLVAEMRTIITSPNFECALEACLDSATAVLFEGLERSVFVSSEAVPGEEIRIRLAGLLPGLARWSRLSLHGLPNELVDNVLGLREVACLSAIVFSKFEENFS
ncbi:hypothetical protein AX17_007054 [Amanita inopinata Kibby_2008]|nr:hypothetical protein AX17_007054 [Amanita inopinata Kibby_2008]